jgi:hypothetical protein
VGRASDVARDNRCDLRLHAVGTRSRAIRAGTFNELEAGHPQAAPQTKSEIGVDTYNPGSYHAKRADEATRKGSAPVVYDQSDAYAGRAGSHTSCFKKLYLFFRCVLRCLMQHSIYGVQISSCAGFDDICACAFACDESAATEVAF